MNTKDIKQGVSAMFDMELNNYLMQNAIDNLTGRASSLAQKRTITKPEYHEPKKIVKKRESSEEKSYIVFLVMGLIADFAFSSYKTSLEEHQPLPGIETILRMFVWAIPFMFASIILWGIWSIVSSLVFSSIDSSNAEKEHKANVKAAKEDFKRRVDDYNNAVVAENKRVHEEGLIKKQLYDDIDEIRKKLSRSKSLLIEMYDAYNILPQYRNIVSVGYMNDLLMIGTATALEGPGQLYEKVRAELREDRILEAINGVSIKLDTLIDTNNRIYGAIQGVANEQQALCNTIEREARQIRDNQNKSERMIEGIKINNNNSSNAVLEYEVRRIRKELEYQEYMKRIRHY